jgi:hypothetical protein
MANPDELRKMTDGQLIEFIFQQFSNSPVGDALAQKNRDLAKAILDSRSSKIAQQQNSTMIKLTKIIIWLTAVMSVLTGILLYKTFIP